MFQEFLVREAQMRIIRIVSIDIVAMFALTIGFATFDGVMSCSPGATFRNGVYVNLTTGKPAPLPTTQVATPPKVEGPTGTPPVSPSGGGGGHSGGGK
jgi:hypothetical protein